MDFDGLVLAPLMGVFSDPVVFTPIVSQPGAPAFAGRGVYKVDNIDVPLDTGIMSSRVVTMGVRVADFAVFVKPGDQLSYRGVAYDIDDTDEDGFGGSALTLKQVAESFVP